jgi:multicomponent Na+:H+ antiporter subunit D
MAMAAGAVLCIIVGSFPGYLYSLLPYNVPYDPFTMYHFTETVQIMGFAALSFFMLKKYLVPEDRICLDMDWFYRRGGSVFLWTAKNPIQWFDTAWGEVYNAVGMHSLMTVSKFWSWFDWNVIDGVVDGLARTVRGMGGRMKAMQSGQIQYTIYYAVSFAALVLIAYVLFQLS